MSDPASGVQALGVFDHVGIETVAIETEVAWYEREFGARVLRWGTHVRTGLRIAMLAVSGAKLELIEVAEATGKWTHTAYRVDDVPAARDRLVAAGAAVESEPFRIEAAMAESCLLRTLGGSTVQLIRYDPDSPDLG